MIAVRRVTPQDSADIFFWRNDPLTVEMSLSQTEVLTNEHAEWFSETLNSSECVHVIGESVGSDKSPEKVGVCRFDRQETNRWIVNINLNPALRGRRLSGDFLAHSIEYLQNNLPSRKVTLVAEVLEKNIPSLKIFELNGFRIVQKLAGVAHMKRELS